MIGSWWALAAGLSGTVLLACIALVVGLALGRPRGGLLEKALRILPRRTAPSPPTGRRQDPPATHSDPAAVVAGLPHLPGLSD